MSFFAIQIRYLWVPGWFEIVVNIAFDVLLGTSLIDQDIYKIPETK